MISFNGFRKKLSVNAAIKTHPGRIRTNNEDNYSFCGTIREDVKKSIDEREINTKKTPLLFAVCDGMGGEEYGEIASLLAVQNLNTYSYSTLNENVRANMAEITEIIDKKRQELNASNMGSTLAALYIDSGYALSCNIGDSRVYFMRQGVLKQISEDHRENGNRLLQYLGVAPEDFLIEPYFSEPIKLVPGDKYLICSDGITDMIDDDELAMIMKEEGDSRSIADKLVDKALKKGGKDNATALVVEIEK